MRRRLLGFTGLPEAGARAKIRDDGCWLPPLRSRSDWTCVLYTAPSCCGALRAPERARRALLTSRVGQTLSRPYRRRVPRRASRAPCLSTGTMLRCGPGEALARRGASRPACANMLSVAAAVRAAGPTRAAPALRGVDRRRNALRQTVRPRRAPAALAEAGHISNKRCIRVARSAAGWLQSTCAARSGAALTHSPPPRRAKVAARARRGDSSEQHFANDGVELADSRRRQAEFAQRRKRLEKEMLAQEKALAAAARCAAHPDALSAWDSGATASRPPRAR